jgi:hypothetical protein
MSSLFDQPPYFILCLLKVWLSLKENGFLCSSCCNYDDRANLKHLLDIKLNPLPKISGHKVQLFNLTLKSNKMQLITEKVVFKISSCSVVNSWQTFQNFRKNNRLHKISGFMGNTSITDICKPVIVCFIDSNSSYRFLVWSNGPTDGFFIEHKVERN